MTVARYEPADLSGADLLVPETDSWIATVAEVAKLSAYLCDTAFVPAGLRGSAPATAATILYGREIGVPPITALQSMHVINGRVGMAAELMRARVLAAGHDLEVIESTAALCRMRGRRRGSETWTEVQWSAGDARQAGLGGDNWRKYPRAMLVARASAELCRLVFPDVTHGMSSMEELDSTAAPGEPAPATATRKVSRAPRATPTPPPEGTTGATLPAGENTPPVVVPQAPPPGGGSGPRAESVPNSPSPAVGTSPPPGDPARTGPPVSPVPPRGVARPRKGAVHVPGDVGLPLDIAPEALEEDPRAQAELEGDGQATTAQIRHLYVLMRRLGVGQVRDDRLHITAGLVERPVQTFNDLTITEASKALTSLLLCLDSDNPKQMLRWVVDETHRRMAEADTGAARRADEEGNDR